MTAYNNNFIKITFLYYYFKIRNSLKIPFNKEIAGTKINHTKVNLNKRIKFKKIRF